MQQARTCHKCGGRMAIGWVAAYGGSGYKQQQWIEGAPEISQWTGVKTKGKETHLIDTYRCERCGLVEQYAPAVRPLGQ